MNGKPDVAKGSYYANPLRDGPAEGTLTESVLSAAYHFPNIWPTDSECPGFERDFKALGRLIITVGKLVAKQCDTYVEKRLPDYPKGYLQQTLATDETTKARLLHYFPRTTTAEDAGDIDSWCGWHVDHSSLTGLTSAMYVRADDANPSSPVEIDSPDPESGLYIRIRSGDIRKVRIPRDCLAFQTGEALQIASGDFLIATPHCVRGCSEPGVARNTFAVFMQPPVRAVLRDGLTFEGYTKIVLQRHYE